MNENSRQSSLWFWAVYVKPRMFGWNGSRAQLQTRLCVLHRRLNRKPFDNEISLQTRRDEAQHLAATIMDILYPGSASPRFLHNVVAEHNTFGCYAVHPVTDKDPHTFLGYAILLSVIPPSSPLSLFLSATPLVAIITRIYRIRRIKCSKQIFL